MEKAVLLERNLTDSTITKAAIVLFRPGGIRKVDVVICIQLLAGAK
jgi:hypothetical protein